MQGCTDRRPTANGHSRLNPSPHRPGVRAAGVALHGSPARGPATCLNPGLRGALRATHSVISRCAAWQCKRGGPIQGSTSQMSLVCERMAEPKIAFNIWAVPAGPTAVLALTAPPGQACDLVQSLRLNRSSHRGRGSWCTQAPWNSPHAVSLSTAPPQSWEQNHSLQDIPVFL